MLLSFISFVVCLLVTVIIAKVYVKLSAGRCKSNTCLVGKTVLITGGNAGMGYRTALALAGRGARVIIADRDDMEKSKKQIMEYTQNTNIVTKHVDFSRLDTVRALANDILATEERLDVLVNNAGAGGLGGETTKDGLHIGMQVNHFAPFLLTNMLAGLLRKSAPSRIIFLSSEASFYNNLRLDNLNPVQNDSRTMKTELSVYANSKLCNIITSNEFARRLRGTGVTSNSVHPGVCNTQIYSRSKMQRFVNEFIYVYLNLISKSAEEGAQTTIHVSLSSKAKNVTGGYWKDCKMVEMPLKAKDVDFAKKIWQMSAEYVQLQPEETHC